MTMIQRAPERKLVVVTLSNVIPSQGPRLAQDLLRLALNEEVALPESRKEVAVPAETLQTYVGEYELRPGFVLKVTLEGDQLMLQATGQPKFPCYAESPVRFFLKVVDATLEFQKDGGGRVTALVLDQNGIRTTGKRL